MNHNIEIKARAKNFSTQLKVAENLSDTPLEILQQEDTFFSVNSGRLKLRKFSESHGELIFYRRANNKHAKQSSYQICPTETPEILKKTLVMALGLIGIVKKTRFLFRYGQTRIHLDKVERLGHFIEFEYVLRPNEDLKNAQNVIAKLMNDLQINEEDLVSGAYIDLLLSDS